MDIFKAFGINIKKDHDPSEEAESYRPPPQQLGFDDMEGGPRHWSHPNIEGENMLNYHSDALSGNRELPHDQAYYDKLRNAKEGYAQDAFDRGWTVGSETLEIGDRQHNKVPRGFDSWKDYNTAVSIHNKDRNTMRRMYPHQFRDMDDEPRENPSEGMLE